MAKIWTDVINTVESDQFSGLAEKVSPASADLLMAEDSDASGAKKKVQVVNLPFEPKISKNTAFNKNFGIISDTVCEGDDSRVVGAVQGPGTAGDENLAIYDGTTGKIIKNSTVDITAVIATSVADQFTSVGEDLTPVSADKLLIERTTTGVKRYIQLGNLPAGAPDFSNTVFPDYAGFDAEVAGVSAINFATGNKQRIAGSAGNITLAAPTVGSYFLLINDSSTFTSIADSGAGTVTWIGPVPEWAAGKLAGIGCYFDGTNWTLNGAVEP